MKKLCKAQEYIDLVYIQAETEYIGGQRNEIAKLHIEKRHTAAWSTINQHTCRKSKPSKVVPLINEKKTGCLTSRSYSDKPLKVRQKKPFPRLKYQIFLTSPVNPALGKKNNSPGLDNIPAIICKDPIFHDLLLSICNHAG